MSGNRENGDVGRGRALWCEVPNPVNGVGSSKYGVKGPDGAFGSPGSPSHSPLSTSRSNFRYFLFLFSFLPEERSDKWEDVSIHLGESKDK